MAMVEVYYEAHDAANIFPMDDESLDSLAEDIKANGQQLAIELLDGKIIDGRRRYQACRRAGVKPITREVMVADPVAYVLSLNLHRRHLSPTQLAMVGARATTLRDKLSADADARKKAGKKDLVENFPQARTRDAVGEMVGVSGKSIDHATKVLRDGTPELIKAVDSDAIAVSTAAKIALESPEHQKAIVERAKAGGKRQRPALDGKTEKPGGDAEAKVVSDDISRGEQESREIRDDFNAKLAKAATGGVYTLAQLATLLNAKDQAILTFIRQCEVSPLVQVHRTYGRKGITQFAFAKTKSLGSADRIQQLAKSIVDDPNVSARAHAAAKRIVSLAGGTNG